MFIWVRNTKGNGKDIVHNFTYSRKFEFFSLCTKIDANEYWWNAEIYNIYIIPFKITLYWVLNSNYLVLIITKYIFIKRIIFTNLLLQRLFIQVCRQLGDSISGCLWTAPSSIPSPWWPRQSCGSGGHQYRRTQELTWAWEQGGSTNAETSESGSQRNHQGVLWGGRQNRGSR